MSQDGQTVRARYRATPELMVTAGIGGVIALLLAVAFVAMFVFKRLNKGDDPAAAFFMIGLIAFPSLWVALHRWRAVIVAEADGLKWRGLGRWRHAHWDGVTDFYSRSISSTQSQFRVETRHGVFSFSHAFEHANELALMIARRGNAVEGIAKRTRDWRGANDWPNTLGEWPHLFGYGHFENRVMPWVSLIIWPVWLSAPWLFHSGTSNPWAVLREIASQLPWPLFLFGTLCLFALPLGMLLLGAAAACNSQRNERFVITTRGLWQCNAEETRAARWDEIHTLRVEHAGRFVKLPLNVLQTDEGTMAWSPGALGNHRLFDSLLAASIPQVWEETRRADYRQESLAPHQVEPDGTMVFHFRTRSARALLWIPSVLALLPLLPLAVPADLVAPGLPSARPASLDPWAIFVLAALATAFGWWCYFTSSVRLNEQGIERITPFGRRFLAWADISEVQCSATRCTLRSGKTKIHLGGDLKPADWDVLRQEIEYRTQPVTRNP